MRSIRLAAAGAVLAVAAWAQNAGPVEGRVINSVDGSPVMGAIVVLQGLDLTGNPPQADSYVVKAGAEGRFRVEQIAPGHYEVRPQREGFTAQPTGVAAGRGFIRFTVEAGQRLPALTLRLIPLGSLAGRALDPDGDPVSGVPVEALRFSYAEGRKELTHAGAGVTDDRGEFRIEGLPPGRYYLLFSDRGAFARLGSIVRIRAQQPVIDFVSTYYPRTTEAAQAAGIDLPAGGEVHDLNVQLIPGRYYSIRVRIAGDPIEPANLELHFSAPRGMSLALDGEKYGAVRSFPNSPPGTYIVRVLDRLRRLTAQQVVRIVDSDVEVTLTPRPEMTISGAVRFEGGARMQVEAIRVSLEADEALNNAAGAVKPDGTFLITGVQPVSYRIHVSPPGGGYVKSIRAGQRDLAAPLIGTSQMTGPLTITIARDGGRVDGAVKDLGGAAVEGASIALVPEGRLADWPDLVRATESGKDGRYDLRDIAPGDYKLFVWDSAEPGAALDPDFRRPFEKLAVAVHIEANGHLMLDVKPLPAVIRP